MDIVFHRPNFFKQFDQFWGKKFTVAPWEMTNELVALKFFFKFMIIANVFLIEIGQGTFHLLNVQFRKKKPAVDVGIVFSNEKVC